MTEHGVIDLRSVTILFSNREGMCDSLLVLFEGRMAGEVELFDLRYPETPSGETRGKLPHRKAGYLVHTSSKHRKPFVRDPALGA